MGFGEPSVPLPEDRPKHLAAALIDEGLMAQNAVLCPGSADLEELLARRILERTGRRINELCVCVADDGVVVRGYAFSYHALQLALAAVREVLDTAPVRMNIEVLAGAPRKDEPLAVARPQ